MKDKQRMLLENLQLNSISVEHSFKDLLPSNNLLSANKNIPSLMKVSQSLSDYDKASPEPNPNLNTKVLFTVS